MYFTDDKKLDIFFANAQICCSELPQNVYDEYIRYTSIKQFSDVLHAYSNSCFVKDVFDRHELSCFIDGEQHVLKRHLSPRTTHDYFYLVTVPNENSRSSLPHLGLKSNYSRKILNVFNELCLFPDNVREIILLFCVGSLHVNFLSFIQELDDIKSM